MKLREGISAVRILLNSVNLDDWIPAKLIHRRLTDKTGLFLKREADDKKLQHYFNIWLPVSLKMTEQPFATVPNYDVVSTVTVSEKLPPVFSSKYGYLMKVSSIDFGRDYIRTTPEDYKSILSREFTDPNKRYFWMSDNKIVTPHSVKNIIVRAVFIDQAQAKKIDADYDNECILLMDEELSIPEHMFDDVTKAAAMDIAGLYKKIIPDQSPDLNQNQK